MTPAAGRDNLTGSLLMVAAMAGFAVEDLFLKSAARTMPVGQILMLFGLGGFAAFAALIRRRGDSLWHPQALAPALLVRAGCEVAGRMFYTLAIALVPLSLVSAILQAAPLVVVAGAAVVFGEKVGWRRWLAVVAGFAGVLIVLRPGLEGFSALSLLAVAGMLGFAGRDLATRGAPRSVSSLHLGAWGFGLLVPTGAAMLAAGGGAVWPEPLALAQVAVATVVGVGAYHALTLAMRRGDVGVVTPFRYTRLVFALILGMVVFGERPDAAMLAGSALVVGSGLFTLTRTRPAPRS